MRKNGFTLAEVLITLSIIGVIAALTLPGLTTNTNRRSVGPALSKAIHNLEAANRALIQEEGVRNLNQLDENYLALLTRILDGEIGTLPNGNSEEEAFIGKDRNSYYVENDGEVQGPVDGQILNSQSGSYWSVIIDVNGNRTPNQGGSDRFRVLVDTKGQVISAGSVQAHRYLGDGEDTITLCDPDHLSLDCTGTIERDGWEARY